MSGEKHVVIVAIIQLKTAPHALIQGIFRFANNYDFFIRLEKNQI